jgi:hypothetical protein
MGNPCSGRNVRRREEGEPSCFWAVVFVLAPLALIVVAFLGLPMPSDVPLWVAVLSPKLALVMAAIGLGTAAIRRQRVPLQVTGVGLAIGLAGYLLLRWLS